jgi:hypothetical protein
MAYNVAGLTNYTKEQEAALVTKSLFDGKTASMIKSGGIVLTGVKSAEKIPILETDIVFQTGGTCGFNSQGTTTLTDRSVTVGKIKVNESLCEKTLEAKATQKKLSLGSQYEQMAFEKEYAEQKAGKTAEALETSDWQGDTASGNANLNKYDGLIKNIDGSGAAIAANTAALLGAQIAAATGITTGNVRSIVNAMWRALPAKLKGKADVRIFAGWDTFEKFIQALTDANLFHYTGNVADGEVTIPGTQYKLVAVHGLDSTNRLFAMRLSNMALGVDLENEEERFEIFFAKEADEIRYINEFKRGINVALPDEVVQFTLA